MMSIGDNLAVSYSQLPDFRIDDEEGKYWTLDTFVDMISISQ